MKEKGKIRSWNRPFEPRYSQLRNAIHEDGKDASPFDEQANGLSVLLYQAPPIIHTPYQ